MSDRLKLALVLAPFILNACERRSPATHTDTASTPVTSTDTTVAPHAALPVSTWDTSAGPIVFVRGNSAADAFVIFPAITDSTPANEIHFDSALARNTSVELFQRGGGGDSARIGALSGGEWDADQCIEWPAAKMQTASSGAAAGGWTVAFLRGRAKPMALDTIEALAHPDSAQLAADITRLVSTAPDDTARTFRGIPYVVRTAYRFSPASGIDGVVADVVRTLNQEATPLEEHTLIVGERPTGSSSPYRLAYREVTSGSEETIESSDVLAAVMLGTPAHADLVLAREGYESNAYALLERKADGSWRLRWTSAHTGC